MDDSPAVEVQHEPEPGECLLPRHRLRTADELLQAESNQYQVYVTEELHKPTRRRVIWEVYAGRGRVASVAESLVLRLKFSPWATVGILTSRTNESSLWNALTLKFRMKCGSHR